MIGRYKNKAINILYYYYSTKEINHKLVRNSIKKINYQPQNIIVLNRWYFCLATYCFQLDQNNCDLSKH